MPRKKVTPRQNHAGVHVWLILMKAFQALMPHAQESIARTGLGDSDFRVLEALLHKGPLPVNTIGPKVNLTPGSISVAVDRLYAKGLVTRVESAEDRRVRIVALTPSGKELIVPIFRKHAADIRRAFAEIPANELGQLERTLKKLGGTRKSSASLKSRSNDFVQKPRSRYSNRQHMKDGRAVPGVHGQLLWHRLLGGSWGERCPRMADYVTGIEARDRATAAGWR